MTLYHLVRALLWLTLVAPFIICGAQQLSDDEQALIDLFVSTGGNSSWKNSKLWLSRKDSTSAGVCDWFGVKCGPASCSNLSCRVVSLVLKRNNLAGTLPSSMGRLTALQTLDLSSNHLQGSLPASLGDMASLVLLDLDSNRLEGSLPLSLGKLPQLQTLDLSANRINGDLNALGHFGIFPVLKKIALSTNHFFGGIPTWLANMSQNLQMLNLGSNRFAGPIPDFIWQLSSLVELNLSDNLLNGSFPISLSNMSALQDLSLSQNVISGRIPSSIGGLTNLTTISLFSMNLSGSIPASIQNLSALRHLDLGSNLISGTLPDEIGRLSALISLSLNSNQLSGSLPQSLYRLRSASIILYENRLTGSISDSISLMFKTLVSLKVSNNLLSGPIPRAMWNLSSLYQLDLSFNQFEGTLGASTSNTKLRIFYAQSNRLSGPFPTTLLTLPRIEEVYLNSNFLSGPIAPFACTPASLISRIELSNNLISEVDVASLFSCPRLAFVDLSQNRIRQSLDFSNSLRLPPFINLSHNRLGPLLADYSLPPAVLSVAVIDIRANAFTCPYPADYPSTVAILFSECLQPWTRLVTYAAIFASIILLLLVLFLVLIRFVSAIASFVKQSQLHVFFVSWAIECIGLVLDGLNLQLILRYLASNIDHCAGLNLFSFFGPLTLASLGQVLCLSDPINDEFPPTATLAQFMAGCRAQNNSNMANRVSSQFQESLCHTILPQCDMDLTGSVCSTVYPELASDGRGDVHRIFFGIVIAVAAVRVVVELARAAFVLMAYRRMSNLAVPIEAKFCQASSSAISLRLFWMAELVGTSVFSPLLLYASRAEFVMLLLQREPTPADFAFRALLAGLLTSIPLLCVNIWFLLRVTQYGLAPPGWLSLMKGLLLVPALLYRSLRATRPEAGKHLRRSEGSGTDMPPTITDVVLENGIQLTTSSDSS
jgi:Leucine-rich repeat (LRR) protein